jgi:ADP-ribose pyrophosphatase
VTYELVSSTPQFDGRIIKVRSDEVRMPDGSVATRDVVRHPGAVAVVALDDEGRIVLVHQYRHPVQAYLDELPAGLLDKQGEPVLDAAKRELFEEAALRAERWDVLVDLLSTPGMTDEAVRIYLARGLSEADESFDPEHEEIDMTLSRVPLADAVQRVFAGEIRNALACAGILAAAHAELSGFAGLRPGDAEWADRDTRTGRPTRPL